MTTATGDGASGDDFARDWQAVRADADIQFAPVDLPQREPPPAWLERFFAWLGDVFEPLLKAIGLSLPTFLWILVGLGFALIVFFVWRLIEPRMRSRGEHPASSAPDWTPDHGEARELLGEADRLAAAGRFDEATHLLLQRSVLQIAAARPDLVEISSTAREIAALPALSEAARGAFAAIADRVEHSLFALRSLTAEDWQAARAAYADFALASPLAPSGATAP